MTDCSLVSYWQHCAQRCQQMCGHNSVWWLEEETNQQTFTFTLVSVLWISLIFFGLLFNDPCLFLQIPAFWEGLPPRCRFRRQRFIHGEWWKTITKCHLCDFLWVFFLNVSLIELIIIIIITNVPQLYQINPVKAQTETLTFSYSSVIPNHSFSFWNFECYFPEGFHFLYQYLNMLLKTLQPGQNRESTILPFDILIYNVHTRVLEWCMSESRRDLRTGPPLFSQPSWHQLSPLLHSNSLFFSTRTEMLFYVFDPFFTGPPLRHASPTP